MGKATGGHCPAPEADRGSVKTRITPACCEAVSEVKRCREAIKGSRTVRVSCESRGCRKAESESTLEQVALWGLVLVWKAARLNKAV